MKILITSLALALGVALTLFADIALKKSDFSHTRWIILGITLYGLTAIPVAILFRLVPFGNLFIIWEAAYLILGIFTATVFYSEAFTLYRFLALAFSLLAVWLSYK
jgi:multidrug transporter EmrE-like cation transporter